MLRPLLLQELVFQATRDGLDKSRIRLHDDAGATPPFPNLPTAREFAKNCGHGAYCAWNWILFALVQPYRSPNRRLEHSRFLIQTEYTEHGMESYPAKIKICRMILLLPRFVKSKFSTMPFLTGGLSRKFVSNARKTEHLNTLGTILLFDRDFCIHLHPV